MGERSVDFWTVVGVVLGAIGTLVVLFIVIASIVVGVMAGFEVGKWAFGEDALCQHSQS